MILLYTPSTKTLLITPFYILKYTILVARKGDLHQVSIMKMVRENYFGSL